MNSILVGKDFSTTVKDFVHTGVDFVPTEDYPDHKVDLVQGRFEIGQPYVVDKHCTRHMGYKVIKPVDPRHKEIDPATAGLTLGLQSLTLLILFKACYCRG